MYKFFLIIVLLTPLISGTSGKIKGRVIDSLSKEPIPGCIIYLESTDYGTLVDNEGHYFILNVPPGLYNLNAQIIGYNKYIIQNIEVNIDLTLTINIELQESSLELEDIIIQAPPIAKG